MDKTFKYIYGPVESWRMGKSLGIDPLSEDKKICNLNCIYCQLGKTHMLTNECKEYVSTDAIVGEVEQFFNLNNHSNPTITENIDYLTFSGRGEPTLAENLRDMILGVRKIRGEEIAVITNSTTFYSARVRDTLSLADLVVAKLDACNELSFLAVDKAIEGISFENVIKGIKSFKRFYKGKLAIQIMFVDQNLQYASSIANIVRELNADEIQINTPLRPSTAKPLNKEGIQRIKSYFSGMPAVTVYEQNRKETIPLNEEATIKRHGNYKKSC